jgi:Eco57I restriction-modification methylase
MLATFVRATSRAADLVPLFVELGYAPDDEARDDGMLAIARWKTFRVVATDAQDPRAAVRATARRLGATAQPGLVAAVGGGTLAIATPRLGVAASSPVLALEVASPGRLQLQLLSELAPSPNATALAHALRVNEVLASEEVGERFFVAFRRLLERVRSETDARGSTVDRTLLALFPLTRVLFLYFVQAKGWLDGRPDYLRAQLDAALATRRHFHRTVLTPLCFGTLNRPPERRSGRSQLGRIPYLNGGLFEPHPLERQFGSVVLPNAIWRDAFDTVFERFRFCTREGEEVDAVAPDMLGRVFERIMDSRERKSSGSYYTPEGLVREVVVATLATALTNATLSHGDAIRLLTAHAVPQPRAAHAAARLRAMRVLDPAVGSGAFLLGALAALTDAWTALHPGMRPAGRARLRRRVLRNHLFGVDVNPIAVRLAELRLWLAVIADDPEADICRVEPLPNLNGVVRQGDALLDPLSAAHMLGIRTVPDDARHRVAAARSVVFAARGPDRATALSDLRDAELAGAREMVAGALAQTRSQLRELASLARGQDLFGGRTRLAPGQRVRHDALRAEVRWLRRAQRQLAAGGVPFFAFEVHAPDVMAAGGFTAVIGNPPWVRAERLPAALRHALGSRFTWWRPGRGRGFQHQPDLAVAFLQRALELTAPGGAVGLLVPSKLASAGYAETARAALVRETEIAYVHRVPDRVATGFGAAVYPLAVVARRVHPADRHQAALDFRRTRTVPQTSLAGGGPWMLVGDRSRSALEALRKSGMPLSVAAPPMLGVKTGADDILVGTIIAEGRERSVVRFGDEEAPIEAALLRPALRGRDLTAFSVRSRRVVIWPYGADSNLLSTLPPLATAWIQRHATRLARRADARDGPAWTLFRVRAAFAPHRVVWPDLAARLAAIALDVALPAAVPLNTCYVSAMPDRESALALSATLNSTWVRVLLRTVADEARGGYRRHTARAMATVPVPPPGPASAGLTTLSLKAHLHHDVSQNDLDRAVAEALGLSEPVRAELRALARDHG